MKNRIFFEAVFKNNPNWTAEDAWKFIVLQNKFLDFPGQKECSEAVYREKWGRLPGELSPAELLDQKRKMIEQLKAELAEAEAKPITDPVKDVPVEVVAMPVVEPPVEEPKRRGRKPNAMTLNDIR
jgi:hypothetical protein